MRKTNIFQFGKEVEGASFIGRKAVTEELIRLLQTRNVAIIGMNRVGKTSLMRRVTQFAYGSREDIILLEESVYISNNSNAFWHRLMMKLQIGIQKRNIRDELIDQAFQRIFSCSMEESYWFTSVLDLNLREILSRLKTLGYHTVLVLDEFDHARELFQLQSGSLGLVRDIASKVELGTTVITLSRRKLDAIEQCVKGSYSTLDGVFDKMNLTGFNADDIKEYMEALGDYDIFPDAAMERRLQELAGNQPYLLSLYASGLAERSMRGVFVTTETLEEIHEQEMDNIIPYYRTLTERIREDGFAEQLRGILCGPTIGITKADIEDFEKAGYISCDESGYYILSQEYTRFFLKNTRDLYPPQWDGIMTAERTLKAIVGREYPELVTYCYQNTRGGGWSEAIQRRYPELWIREDVVDQHMRDNWEDYQQNSSVLDTLDLSFVVRNVILRNWETRFSRHFRNQKRDEWQPRLELLIRARTPMAHALQNYLRQEEVDQLLIFCRQINELNSSV